MLRVIVLGVAADQAFKALAAAWLKDGTRVHCLWGALRFEYTENPGAILGLGSSLPPTLRWWLLVAGVGMLLTGLVALGVFSPNFRRTGLLGLSLAAAGGFGNWIDRIRYNAVVDFMQVVLGPFQSGIFNVADLLIDLGVILMVAGVFQRHYRPGPPEFPTA